MSHLIPAVTSRALSERECYAYDAPFPEESFKEGARVFPSLVAITTNHAAAEDNREAFKRLEGFTKPFLCAFSGNR